MPRDAECAAHVVADLVELELPDRVGYRRLTCAEHQRATIGRAALHGVEQVAIDRDLQNVLGSTLRASLASQGS